MAHIHNSIKQSGYSEVCILLYLNKEALIGGLTFILAIILFCFPSEAYAYDGSKYGIICSRVLEAIEGKFGALLSAAAGMGAIVASAAGGFKMAWSLVVVAVGGFILRSYQLIWFAPCGGG